MSDRMKLHTQLVEKIKNVYFQPPETIKLSYPCIIYNISIPKMVYADNSKYLYHDGYDLQLICTDQDELSNLMKDILSSFQHINCSDTFITDNLYHANFTLYY